MSRTKLFFRGSLLVVLLAGVFGGLTSCNTYLAQRIIPHSRRTATGESPGVLVGVAVDQANASAYGEKPPGGYPHATPTGRKGLVVSPYKPYYTIDVTAVGRRSLVRDTSCDRLFLLP